MRLVQLVNAPLEIAASSDWSGAMGAVVFIAFLAWVFAASVSLVLAMRRGQIPADRGA